MYVCMYLLIRPIPEAAGECSIVMIGINQLGPLLRVEHCDISEIRPQNIISVFDQCILVYVLIVAWSPTQNTQRVCPRLCL